MRLLFRHPEEQTWEVNRYVWLENVSDQHIMLRLKSGDLRLDKGRKQRFRPDVLEIPQVKQLIADGQVVVSD